MRCSSIWTAQLFILLAGFHISSVDCGSPTFLLAPACVCRQPILISTETAAHTRTRLPGLPRWAREDCVSWQWCGLISKGKTGSSVWKLIRCFLFSYSWQVDTCKTVPQEASKHRLLMLSSRQQAQNSFPADAKITSQEWGN